MSAVRQRGRLVRVRRIQHDVATIAASRAAEHVRALEKSEARLMQVRDALTFGVGVIIGATVASRGELISRLDHAKQGLQPSIAGAKAAAAAREQARIGTRREQDCAEKLQRKAVSAAARAQDKRMAANFRPRNRTQSGDE